MDRLPVFGLTGGETNDTIGVHCDLVSKIPHASQTPSYNLVCYEPLAATQRAVLQALGGHQFSTLSNDVQAELLSERLLLLRVATGTPLAPPDLQDGVQVGLDGVQVVSDAAKAYLQHWLALHELGPFLRLPPLAGRQSSPAGLGLPVTPAPAGRSDEGEGVSAAASPLAATSGKVASEPSLPPRAQLLLAFH